MEASRGPGGGSLPQTPGLLAMARGTQPPLPHLARQCPPGATLQEVNKGGQFRPGFPPPSLEQRPNAGAQSRADSPVGCVDRPHWPCRRCDHAVSSEGDNPPEMESWPAASIPPRSSRSRRCVTWFQAGAAGHGSPTLRPLSAFASPNPPPPLACKFEVLTRQAPSSGRCCGGRHGGCRGGGRGGDAPSVRWCARSRSRGAKAGTEVAS